MEQTHHKEHIHHNAVKQVLQQLEQEHITYCVLRNYDFLLEGREPSTLSERSVDLCVSQRDFPRFDALMAQMGYQKRKQQFSRKHVAYFRLYDLHPVSFDVQPGGVHWNDMRYMGEEDILGSRVRRSYFYVPSDRDTVVMLLLHSILGKRRFKLEYQQKIAALWKEVDKNHVQDKLSNVLSANAAQEIMKLVEQNNFDAIIIRKSKYIALFLSSPRRLAKFIPLTFRWLYGKKFWKAAPLISIIGPDGAGKSTLVSSLQEYLQQHGRKVAIVYTGRGKMHMLPLVVRGVGYYYKQGERRRDQIQKPNLAWRKVIYMAYSPVFILELGLRYLKYVIPKRRTKHIVITDRYCTDMWLMKHIPLFMKKVYVNMFPKPTLTFYLYNDADVLHERRPKETREELQRQLGLFDELKNHVPMKAIKTTDMAKTKREVLQTVMVHLYREWW